MNIYVGNLPYTVRDEELRDTFAAYGTVVTAEVIFDKRTRRSRGYGFVEMSSDAEAQRAIDALNGKELHGRELRVDASQPKSEKPHTQSDRGRSEGGGGRPDNTARPPRRAQAPGRDNVSPAVSAEPAGIRGFFKKLFG